MKNIKILCLLVAVTFSTIALANQPSACNVGHKINGYKYLCMEQQGNLHDLEDKFNAFFGSIGFSIITPDEEEEMSEEERQYVLYGSYVYNTVPDGLDIMTLTLRNSKGKIVFSSTKEAACFVSVKRCANKASDKIINQIKDLNYTFDHTLVDKGKKSKGETESAEETANEEKVKLARQMKADGMTTEQIEKYTGIKAEEIEKL